MTSSNPRQIARSAVVPLLATETVPPTPRLRLHLGLKGSAHRLHKRHLTTTGHLRDRWFSMRRLSAWPRLNADITAELAVGDTVGRMGAAEREAEGFRRGFDDAVLILFALVAESAGWATTALL